MLGLSHLINIAKNIIPSHSKSAPQGDSNGWSIFGSDINSSWGMDWWQKGFAGNKVSAKENTAAEACVSQYARTIAMLPITHTKELASGGRETVKNSKVVRALNKPNGYQTRADFVLNLIRSELFTGNGYAVAIRNGNFDITQLHLLPSNATRHYINPDDQEIYYYVDGNPLIPNFDYLVPARDILHCRMQTSDNDPLKGETPLQSGLLAASAGTNIQRHNASFFNNMSRPSGTINTDMELNEAQIKELRSRWEEQSAGLNAGKTPILSSGLKWQPLSVNANDAQMIEFYKLSVSDIARVYGMPQALIGIMDAQTFSNVESLLNMWVSTSLGFMVDHIELNLEKLFDLPDDEHINFDLDYMLRGDFQSRATALKTSIESGVMSINEARNKSGLKPVEDGDSPRLQMQNVPLTYYDDKLMMDKERLEMDKENSKSIADEGTATEPVSEPEKYIDPLTAIKKAMS